MISFNVGIFLILRIVNEFQFDFCGCNARLLENKFNATFGIFLQINNRYVVQNKRNKKMSK